MYILGICGGLNRPGHHPFTLPFLLHDAAAVLLKDGEVVAAIEEERLNRIKHTNCFPEQAIQFCLDAAGVTLNDVDRIAYYFTESFADYIIRHQFIAEQRPIAFRGIRAEIDDHFRRFSGQSVADRLRFIDHHRAHAASTFYLSGFDDALVAVLDGMGENVSFSIYSATQSGLKLERTFDQGRSLGILYLTVCNFLGYKLFDEYKVMALGSFGSRERYRSLFAQFYRLLPGGDYDLNLGLVEVALGGLFDGQTPGPALEETKQHVAAALQETLETIVLHVLRAELEKQPHRNLCLAGGVALNCSMNGRILEEGLFEQIFVQPASHDAGGALGAALEVWRSAQGQAAAPARRLEHVYWGSPIGDAAAVRRELAPWSDIIEVERCEQVSETAARYLQEGAVIGWVQGRSEFGPRALGNRSILADPRRPENKARINAIIKEREGYRPFAPMVLEAALDTFFHVPGTNRSFPYMVFVLQAREEARKLLGAVTHVDGTARVQTVNPRTNPKVAALLEAFGQLTGVPVLLNTSFNNNAEPIVNSVQDALVTFCTSELDLLFIDDLLIRKRGSVAQAVGGLVPTLPEYTRLTETVEGDGRLACRPRHGAYATFRPGHVAEVAEPLYWALASAGGARTLDSLLAEVEATAPVERERLLKQAYSLWQQRLIGFLPPQA